MIKKFRYYVNANKQKFHEKKKKKKKKKQKTNEK